MLTMRSAETQFQVQACPVPQPGPHGKPQPRLPFPCAPGEVHPAQHWGHQTCAYRLLQPRLEGESPRELGLSSARTSTKHEEGKQEGGARCAARAGPVRADPALCTCTCFHPP